MRPLIIAIAGGTGSGKSFLSDKIISNAKGLSGSIIEIDSYYRDLSELSIKKRESINFDHPNSFEFKLLNDHINQVKSGMNVHVPVYDYKTHTRTDRYTTIHPSDYIIINGIMALHSQELRESFDLSIYIDIPNDLRLSRRIKRDMRYRKRTLNSIISQYLKSVKTMHDRFVQPSMELADLVIEDTGTKEINDICSRIKILYDTYSKK